MTTRRDVLRFGLGTLVFAKGCDRLSLQVDLSNLPDVIDPVTPNEAFYEQDCCGQPELDAEDWTLELALDGEVLQTLQLADLVALDAREKEHTLQCIGGTRSNQQINNALWTGLPFVDILDALGFTVPESVVQLVFYGFDGYDVSVPATDIEDGPLWLVWEMNGTAIPVEHGFPVRVLTPGRYGTKNPKWPIRIDFVSTPHLGYWERLGWSDEATYKAHTWIASPPDRSSVPNEPLTILGVAFAGTDPIESVDVRINGGAWQPAEVTYAGGPDVWSLWRFTLPAQGPGEVTIQARATTQGGVVTPDRAIVEDRFSGYDASMAIVLDVLA